MTLRKLLERHSDATMFTDHHSIDIEYLTEPNGGNKPDVTVARNKDGYVICPNESLFYITAEHMANDVFVADAYDAAPAVGEKFSAKEDRLTLLVSDLYGNLSAWEY